MTIQDIIYWFANNSRILTSYYLVLFIVSLLGLLFLKRDNFKNPLDYLYSVIIYAVTIPGLLSVILILYGFFFLKINLLQVNVLAYFLPLLAMIVILLIVKKTIPLKLIPGFERLSGLFLMIMVAFVITYILQRMFFGVFFIGKFQYLILMFLALLFLLRLGWNKIIR